VKAANAVALSLLDAIAAAERHSKGGKILEVILEASSKPTVSAAAYLLKIYRQGEIWEGRMDANSGAILGEEKASPESWLDVDDKAVLAGLETASTTIVPQSFKRFRSRSSTPKVRPSPLRSTRVMALNRFGRSSSPRMI